MEKRYCGLGGISFLAMFLAACGGQSTTAQLGPSVLVVAVEERHHDLERSFPGRVSAIGEVRLGFEVPGQIDAILVKPGDRVVAGQALAQLATHRFTIAIEQAESAVAAAQAAAQEAEAAYQRAVDLEQREAIAPAALEHAQAQVDAARAQLRGARAGLDQAQTNFRDATLFAPYDGLIAERLIEDFSQIQAKQGILVLQAYDRLRISIQVPESYVLGLHGNREQRRRNPPQATVQFVGHPELRLAADFDEVVTAPEANSLSWALRFVMPVPDEVTVLPGMSCMVTLDGAAAAGAIADRWVPLAALSDDGAGGPALWVVAENQRVERRAVSLGTVVDGMVVVAGEVAAGDIVVRAGHALLTEGMIVQPRLATRP